MRKTVREGNRPTALCAETPCPCRECPCRLMSLGNLSCSSGRDCYWCQGLSVCCAHWSVERPSSSHGRLPCSQEGVRGGVGYGSPPYGSQRQTSLVPNQPNFRLRPSHTPFPLSNTNGFALGWLGVSKLRGFIPNRGQVSSLTTDCWVTLCKSVPFSVLGPEDSDLLAALVC